MAENLIDKALVNGIDMELDKTGDMQTVSESSTTLQTAQNRCLAYFNSWVHDRDFGSTLYTYLRTHSVWQLTDEIAKRHIEKALTRMISDGRILEVKSVKTVERDVDRILFEVVLDLGTQIGTITYEVTL